MHNVPLDNTYNHTIKFASLSAQQTYFNSVNVVKFTLDEQTYQRVEKGKMRIEIKAEDLYDCNYLAFQNTSFGAKWFYAFITGVEYVNNVTSEITFELDVMQTYLFDITVGECFVEREHVIDDSIGANTIAEPVDCPEPEVEDGLNLFFFNWYVVVGYAPGLVNQIANFIYDWAHHNADELTEKIRPLPSGRERTILEDIRDFMIWLYGVANRFYPDNLGDIKEHQFTGKKPYVSSTYFEDVNQSTIDTFCREIQTDIDAMTAVGGKVLEVYQVPEEIVNDSWADSVHFQVPESMFDPIPTFSYINKTDLYTPKNNKLYTSPYQYLKVINKQGGEMNLAYEKVQDKHFTFSSSWQNGQVSCFIENQHYGTKGSLAGECKDLCRLQLNNFPVCNFNTTGIIQKLVNSIELLAKTLANDVRQGMGLSPMMPTAPVQQRNAQGRFKNTSQYIQQYEQYQSKLDAIDASQKQENFGTIENYIAQVGSLANSSIGAVNHMPGGSTNSGNDIANNNFGYRVFNMAITAEYAEIIDNFFERFGYAVKKNKVPNMSTRPHWNYVKTTDAYITGNCPADSLAKIISIFNHGVTFWKVPSEVGNYSLNNH